MGCTLSSKLVLTSGSGSFQQCFQPKSILFKGYCINDAVPSPYHNLVKTLLKLKVFSLKQLSTKFSVYPPSPKARVKYGGWGRECFGEGRGSII